jgi:hypothetical protein
MKGLFKDEEVMKLSLQEKMVRIYDELVILFHATPLPEEDWDTYEEKYYYKKLVLEYKFGKCNTRKKITNSFISQNGTILRMFSIDISIKNDCITFIADNQKYTHPLKHLLYFKKQWKKLK